MLMESESQASLASNGIPMVESSVEDTRGFDVTEGIDMLKNTKVSDMFDEGKDMNCDGNFMETDENDLKPSKEFEQQQDLKLVGLKEISREEEDPKSDSLNVLDDERTFEDILNGVMTDIQFEKALKELSREEEDEKSDSLNVLDDGRTFEDFPNGGAADIRFENTLKELSREEEDEKSDSSNVLDDGRTFEDIHNGGTADIHFKNAWKELSREEEDEKSDSLNVLDDGRTFEDISNAGAADIHFENALKELSREEEDEKSDSSNVLDDGRTFEDILNGGTAEIHLKNAWKALSREEEDEKSDSLNVLDNGSTFEDIPNSRTTDIHFENALKELSREEEDEKSGSLTVLDEGRTFEDIRNDGTTDIHFENALKELSRKEEDENSDSWNVVDDGRTFEDIPNVGIADIHFENALKESSREEEDEKSNSLNVLDDGRTFEDIFNGGTFDIHFENLVDSHQLGQEGEKNEQEDSLDNGEDAKMSQIEDKNEPDQSDSTTMQDFFNGGTSDIHVENPVDSHQLGQEGEKNEQEDPLDNDKDAKMSQIEDKNEPDQSDSSTMQDLATENSPREFINEDCFEGNQLHQSDKIKGWGQIEDVPAIEDVEGKEAGKAEDNAMKMPTQDYELEPPAAVKHLEPEEVLHQKSMESTESETQNTIEEDAFHFEPEIKILSMQTNAPSFETKSNEYDAEKIHVDIDACLEFSSMLESESLSPLRCVEDSIHGPTEEHDPKQICEDCDMGLEYFNTPESNSLSGPTDNEDFNAESTENKSCVMPKSDSFSFLRNKNNVSTESREDANFVSINVKEITDFVITAGREALIIDQPLEMHIAEAMTEKVLESEATKQDVYVAEEHGEYPMKAKDIDSNANTQPEQCREQPLCFQANTDLVSAIGVDKDQRTPNPEEEDSPNCQSVTVSIMEHDNQQTNAAEEEQVLVLSGIDSIQVPSESGAADDHVINRQLSLNENLICEQSLLEQQQPSLPLRPLEEKGSWAEHDKDEQLQQKWTESVEFSFVIDESELGPPREGFETVELPFATEERSCTDDCDQVAESSIIEETEDAPRVPSESGAADDHVINRQLTLNENLICEQSLLEQQQPSLPLRPLEEKGSWAEHDKDEQLQQKRTESVEFSFVIDESELGPPREGFETVELPSATEERSCTDDCDQVAESSIIEETEDTPRVPTDMDAGNRMQKNIETIDSAFIIDETEGMCKEGTKIIELSSPIDETERISNECFKTVELPCAIDETKCGFGVEAVSDDQQLNEMIEVSAIEKLPEAVTEDQSQTKRGLQNGSEELLKCASLDVNNVDDDPTTNLHGDSSSAVQIWAQINGEGAKAEEPDLLDMAAEYPWNGSEELLKCASLDVNNVDNHPTTNLHGDSSSAIQIWAQIKGEGAKAEEPDLVDMAAEYPWNDEQSTVTKTEASPIAVSQTPVQVSESIQMDNGLAENRLLSDQQREAKLQLQANEVMAKTTSQMSPRSSFSEPKQVIPHEQLTVQTTEVHKTSALTSSSGTSLTHRGQESHSLEITENNDSTLTVPREKVPKTDAKRASVWDCCGFWDWLHGHED